MKESPRRYRKEVQATLRINIRNDSSRALDHHFVLYVLVPLVLFVFVAEAAHRETILRIFGHVGCIRVDAFYVDGRQRPREGRCLQVRYGWMPRGQVSWLFRLAVPRGQFLDDLQIEVTDYNYSTITRNQSPKGLNYMFILLLDPFDPIGEHSKIACTENTNTLVVVSTMDVLQPSQRTRFTRRGIERSQASTVRRSMHI